MLLQEHEHAHAAVVVVVGLFSSRLHIVVDELFMA